MNLRHLSILALALAFVAHGSYASEISGTLTTGVGNGAEGTVIAMPVATPAPGTFTSAQSVSLAANGSSSIHYTTDGTDPTCGSGAVYASAIAVSNSLTLKAIACYPQSNASSIGSYIYNINIPAPPPPPPPPSGGGGGGGDSGGGAAAPTSALNAAAQKVDTNKDNKIDVLDFVIVMANWGKTESGNVADFNGDGTVDILDFVLLMANWLT